MRAGLVGGALAVALLLAGCSSGDGGGASTTTARSAAAGRPCSDAEPGSATDLSNEPGFQVPAPRWTDRGGCWVRSDVLVTLAGPEECGWEDTETLIIGERLGDPWFPDKPSRQYLRDPEGKRGDAAVAKGFDADATLPAGARDTGYRRAGAQLWVVDSDPSAVWLQRGSTVERWPRWDNPRPCEKAGN